MIRRSHHGLIAAALAFACLGQAAEIVPQRLATLSLTTIFEKQIAFGGNLPAAKSPIALYEVRYNSTDYKNGPIALSGLLALPTKGAPKGLVVYYHGTTSDRAMSPSKYLGQKQNPEVEAAVMAFATGGYAVAMPDYIGLGESMAVHPYPWGSSNAASGIDMISAARSWAARAKIPVGPRLFISGYSEGGAVAMWAVRRLEEAVPPTFVPAMAAPMSGPYDLSGTAVPSLLRGGLKPLELGEKVFFLSLSAYSAMSYLNQVDLKDYFAPSFATYIPHVFEEHLSDRQAGTKLAIEAFKLRAVDSVSTILTSRFRDAIRASDSTDPVLAELTKNDCYDWAPRTKMMLVYLANDKIVVPGHTRKAIAAMRSRGVRENTVRTYRIDKSGLDHGSAIPTALVAARRFFDGGFAAARGS